MALITAMIGLATLTVSQPRMDATWVSFCAGAKTESQTAAVPAFPRGFRRGWKDCRPLRYWGCVWSPFCGSIHAIESVGVPSACRRLPAAAAVMGLSKSEGVMM